jgi:hypothetical protein
MYVMDDDGASGDVRCLAASDGGHRCRVGRGIDTAAIGGNGASRQPIVLSRPQAGIRNRAARCAALVEWNAVDRAQSNIISALVAGVRKATSWVPRWVGARSSAVYYHGWGVRQARVSCTPVGIEIILSRFNPTTWLIGLFGRKVIPWSSIEAGFAIGPVIRLVFDTDDEIIISPNPLASYPAGDLGFLIIVEPVGAQGWWPAVREMIERQRQLPPASWQKGRGSGRSRSA